MMRFPDIGQCGGHGTMIRVGVIGYGYWGPNLVRNFADNPDCTVVAVCDGNPDRLKLAQKRYPSIFVTTNSNELIDRTDVDAVVIATPADTHYSLGQRALSAGKHVLIEKPLTSTIAESEALIEEAEKRRRVLMVDHTFLYTGAVRKIKQMLDAGDLGTILYYDSVRVNLGLFQPDVNVIWDLAVHDVAIMDYLLPTTPFAVSATGMTHLAGCGQSIGYMTCLFNNNLIAHIHVNWLAPVKIRRTLLGGNRKMVVYDDVEPSEKVKIYDKGVSIAEKPDVIFQKMIQYRMGDMYAPELDTREALSVEVAEFVRCIETNVKPISDGAAGLRVVRLLEAATQSMQRHGRPVEIKDRSITRDSSVRPSGTVSDHPGRNSSGLRRRSELEPIRSR
jgi:predicted dehydrogenase